MCEGTTSTLVKKRLVPLRPVFDEGMMEDYCQEVYMNMGEITEQHLKDIKDTFNLLDSDGDGRLTKKELETLLRYSGSLKSESEMDALLEPIDSDHNGSIDYEEFKNYIIEKGILKSLADEVCYEMKDAFNTFDKNGDGFIEKEELKKVLTQIGDKMPDELADEFIKEADLNGDGKIDYEENTYRRQTETNGMVEPPMIDKLDMCSQLEKDELE